MTFFPVKASVLALALFSAAGAAQAASADATRLMQMAQAEGETPPPPPPEPMIEDPPLPPFDPQQAQPEPQIEQPPLPPFDPQQAQPEPQPEPQPAPQPAVEQVQPEPPAAPAVQPEASSGSPEVAAFLLTVVPAAELGEEALRQQMQRAMALSKSEGLSPDQRSALRNVIREARAELGKKPAPDQAQQPAPQPPVVEQPAPQPQPPVAEQPAPQPQPPVAEQPAPQPQPPVAQQPAPQPQPPVAEQQTSPVKVDPALERRAQAYLNDTADVSTMKRKQLRKRLAEVRDLLASNRLTPATRDALRAKLARERAVLRTDVATSEGLPPPDQPQPPPGQKPGQQQGGKGNDADQRKVLQDRRPSRELDDRELVRRIDTYRDVVGDDRYAADERMMWRRQMEEDRRYLRRQMIDDRRQREAQLRGGGIAFNIDIYDGYEPGYDVPDDLFAAEADDEELAGVLVAPPRRAIDRRYTVEEIENSPDARDAVARIEIDTVHFGFGEGYLREEEIDKLDRIASILERILASHPDEVFLIEGHTDAVGSDAANLRLSRQRATAVKEALATYYVIPPESLQTVGLGERYLKIPTSQPEAENRRVSLARITPLLGQLD